MVTAPKAVYDPLDHDAGTIVYGPYFFFLITHPQGNVLFDVGLPSQVEGTGGRGRGGGDVRHRNGPRPMTSASKLQLVGLAPADISHVIVSHLHFDHAGGLQFFPEAKIIVQRRELQFAFWPPTYSAAYMTETTSTTP